MDIIVTCIVPWTRQDLIVPRRLGIINGPSGLNTRDKIKSDVRGNIKLQEYKHNLIL